VAAVGVPVDVVAGATQEQALEILKFMSPFWFALQLLLTKVGMAVGATLVVAAV
jgi:hypothetical protein